MSKARFIVQVVVFWSIFLMTRGQDSDCLAPWATGYDWIRVCTGEPLRGGAVMIGRSLTDGDVYAARSVEGEPGKLNMENGKMYAIYTHGQGHGSCAEQLVLHPGIVHRWLPYRKGDPVPEGAVLAGETNADGKVYIGRNKYSKIQGSAGGKVNIEGDSLHNLWIHGQVMPWLEGEILVVQRPEVQADCQVPPSGAQWARVCKGDLLPGGAVMAGYTGSDEDVYVGRSVANEPGKINLEGGRMYAFYSHSQGKGDCALALLLHAEWTQEWVPYKKGDPVPDGALLAGETSADGEVYVGRNVYSQIYGSSTGKINVDNGSLHNLWIHGFMTAWTEGEILVVKRAAN